MRVLIATDSFPPGCGGSGWSTYELARGLRARGHEIVVCQPRPGRRGRRERTYEGFTVREVGAWAPAVPYLRNYLKNERLSRRLAPVLRRIIREQRIDLVHGQHVLSTPASIAAARAEGVPVVCTVRDYWPVCYWSDLIHDPDDSGLCPGCSPSMMRRCIRPRGGAAWRLALPLVPYMSANLSWKRRMLARADAVIAVSSAIARDLKERAPEVPPDRIVTIPNPVDLDAIERGAAARAPLEGPYAIYAGKLAPNKGVIHLLPAVTRAGLGWPLVVVGEGPDRAALEREAVRAGRDVHFVGWVPREQALAWLRHASLVVFPSHGPESLSRVLLEASALSRPIAAMDTGGTRDIIIDEETGLLSRDAGELAEDIRRLVADPDLATRLGQAAREHVRRSFDARAVVARVEALYARLLDAARLAPPERHRAGGARG